MKTSKRILSIAIGAIVASSTSVAIAQDAPVRLEGTTAIVPNAGNALERELTPALREQARKKAILENKKLDLEIEKVDLDILKAQQESLTVTNPISAFGGNTNNFAGMQQTGGRAVASPKVIDATNLNNNTVNDQSVSLPAVQQAVEKKPEVINISGEALDNSDKSIRVLMIGGNETDLKAKVMHNRQGGYVVGKGDILPNGKKVVRVTSQFIEVVHPKGKPKTKIYVSGYPSEAENKEWAEAKAKVDTSGQSGDSASLPSGMPMGASMANAIPTPFGIPIAGIPTVVSPPLAAGQIR